MEIDKAEIFEHEMKLVAVLSDLDLIPRELLNKLLAEGWIKGLIKW